MKQINAYLNFDGNCREAMTLYAQCLEADLHTMSFSDMPGQAPPGTEDRIMHAALTKKPAMMLMVSDCNSMGAVSDVGSSGFGCAPATGSPGRSVIAALISLA